MKHERFTYRSLEEIQQKAEELQVHLPFAKDTHVLTQEVSFGNVTLKNRMGIAPMEGADALPDGSPSELTLRRYVREAEGGSAMIWFEAISIVPEGRSSAHQLMLTRDNLENYKRFTFYRRHPGGGDQGQRFCPLSGDAGQSQRPLFQSPGKAGSHDRLPPS